ncbi:sulfur carrier protein ThiS [Basilea psittacipulmonis]|uniref:Thiamine biosynthesis protein ThiS n=1 Tax=Basilea psittacipulmonis DSM 24701 TaxID=1072685 RepID=A0A077DED4_9BURK|nr:sulfur carrier protein ThiS [Basilea psittacipulmonis]AIL33079.1 thiamine biosynthesis protein ThiS [Basilea psittacipulmonis DSM 24701]
MKITVNGEVKEVEEAITLDHLIESLLQETGQNNPQLLATAVNEVFVPRSKRSAYQLKEGDAIFTFTPITGG